MLREHTAPADRPFFVPVHYFMLILGLSAAAVLALASVHTAPARHQLVIPPNGMQAIALTIERSGPAVAVEVRYQSSRANVQLARLGMSDTPALITLVCAAVSIVAMYAGAWWQDRAGRHDR